MSEDLASHWPLTHIFRVEIAPLTERAGIIEPAANHQMQRTQHLPKENGHQQN